MHAWLRISLCIAFAVGLGQGLAAPSAVAASGDDKAAFVRQAIATHFVPRMAAFARTTAPLVEAIDAMCREPGPATLGPARAAFVRSLLAWESASAISYGPIAARRSVYRIDFWPVRTSLLLPLLGNPPATVAELERVGGPAKGYPALEWLLWTPSDIPGVLLTPSHCRYARVVALEIADEAQALESAFADLAAQVDPTESADERFAELLGVMLGGLEKLGVRKIDKPSRIGNGNRYARTLSDQTATEWRAQWASLRDLFGGDGTGVSIGVEAYLRAHDQAAVADRLRAALRRVDAAMDLVTRATQPLGVRVAKELLALRVLYAEDIAGALQVTIEFDENDGD